MAKGRAAERIDTAEIVRGLDDAIKGGAVMNIKALAAAINTPQSVDPRAIVDKIHRKGPT